MQTRIYKIQDLSNESVQKDIKDTLLSGKNVVFPTETVYGIGGHALSKLGIEGIYKVKGRPSDNPLIMHLSDVSDLEKYVKNIKPYVHLLIKAFWPGPLTLVFEKTDIVPKFITGGLNTLGIRVPGSEVARKVIEIAGVPICAPSANVSGRPSSTLLDHVVEDFMDRVDIIIDGGKSEIGLESTVVDVTKDIPVVLRPGFVTPKQIKDIVGDVIVDTFIDIKDTPMSPGMKYKHYAPKGQLTIVKGDLIDVKNYIEEQVSLLKEKGLSTGVIVTMDLSNTFDADMEVNLGELEDSKTIASNLFAALRKMDSNHIEYIFSVSLDEGPLQDAIMNRLLKAANNNIVYVSNKDK